jgi:hypothetical protein
VGRGRPRLRREVLDPGALSTAFEAIGEPVGERPLVLFELGLDDVLTTQYVGDEPQRRRRRAEPVS